MGRRTRKGHMPLRPLRIGPPSGERVWMYLNDCTITRGAWRTLVHGTNEAC